VYGVKDRQAYRAKLGSNAHERLKVKPKLNAPVNYGAF
jgi:hypothetical protein